MFRVSSKLLPKRTGEGVVLLAKHRGVDTTRLDYRNRIMGVVDLGLHMLERLSRVGLVKRNNEPRSRSNAFSPEYSV